MGSIQNSEYYDKIYSTDPSYDVHYTKSVYYTMWLEVMKLVQTYAKNTIIMDAGCGTGQFAQMLRENGYTKYIGMDFSEVAIQKAKEKFDSNSSITFICYDVNEGMGQCNLLIALEFLEHIDDLIFLKDYTDTDIIFTVPDFDNPAHVQYFSNEESIRIYYKNHIEFESITKFHKYFICKGKIK
ncbi:MAG TPA: class I SAM-dependent methyltransferase [bacterium]|nr:class I SAM-dependent methyltransferase [bacterium]